MRLDQLNQQAEHAAAQIKEGLGGEGAQAAALAEGVSTAVLVLLQASVEVARQLTAIAEGEGEED